MSKYERRQWFERLCELRFVYASRGDEDQLAVISIEDAIALAERALAQVVMVGEPIPDAQADEIVRRIA